jgi:hypothetical protein
MGDYPSNEHYGAQMHLYPVYSADYGFEGAVKRYTPLPFPEDVYKYALMGLPKKFPLTGEPIPMDVATDALNSAITEIEMQAGIDLTPTEHWQSFDYISDSFSSNYSGFILERWPSIKVIDMKLAFPHTEIDPPVQTYDLPAAWISHRRNRVNVVASFGAVVTSTNVTNLVNAGGLFTFLSGFSTGPYRPAMVRIQYVAGFPEDKVPTIVSDWVKSFAAWRLLQDIIPVLFPVTGTAVGIDGVSQSAQIALFQAFTQRIAMLEKKCHDQKVAVNKLFGRTLKSAFIGT